MPSFTNFDICYTLLANKIFNLLYNISYLLFEIGWKKINLSKNHNLYPYTTFIIPAIISICNINKIFYTKLPEDSNYFLIAD